MAAVTHDEMNMAAYADAPVHRLMSRIFSAGFHENTLILFYSDHGIVFGSIVKTESGYHESRLPFMYLHLPKSLTLKDEDGSPLNSSQLAERFQSNTRRLTSQFDVHGTLLHVLNERPLGPSSFMGKKQYGLSLFTEIPLNRTCEDAGIKDEYCLCRRFVPLTDDESRGHLVAYILKYLNDKLEPYKDKCSTLSLSQLLQTKVSDSVGKEALKSSLQTVSVRLMTTPGNGTLDVTLKAYVDSSGSSVISSRSSIQAVSSVTRLDRYAEQSYCVPDTPVESFCYCKGLLQP